MIDTILKAATTFIRRQDRVEHPNGKFDNGGRWYPSQDEHADCCDGVRSPSRSWPYSYMVHCRTAKHIANVYGVDEKEIKRAAKTLRDEAASE